MEARAGGGFSLAPVSANERIIMPVPLQRKPRGTFYVPCNPSPNPLHLVANRTVIRCCHLDQIIGVDYQTAID